MRYKRMLSVGIVACMLVLAGCAANESPDSERIDENKTQVIGFEDEGITCVIYNEYTGQGNDNTIDCVADETPAPHNEALANDVEVVQKTDDVTCVVYDEYSGQGDDNDISCVVTD